MNLYTNEEMRAIDRDAMARYGIAGAVLMDNAGKAVAHLIAEYYSSDTVVGIVCGKGNNGGDGFATAHHLSSMGFKKIVIILLPHKDEIRGDALNHFEKIDAHKISIKTHDDIHVLKDCQLIVDAILGTGLKEEVREPFRAVIHFINALQKQVISIDVPSGLSSDTGEVLGTCIRAHATVTLAGAKVGCVLHQAAPYVGHLHMKDIGIPAVLLRSNKKLLEKKNVQSLIPMRAIDAHKGSFGHVLSIGSAPGMPGAIQMSALAALRIGCGVSTIAHLAQIDRPALELISYKLGFLWKRKLKKLLKEKQALALGPGLGVSWKAKKMVHYILKNFQGPLVVDADALNSISEMKNGNEIIHFLQQRKTEAVFTPHPGEFSRLTHYSTAEVQKHRTEYAQEFAHKWNVVLVLKGSGTVIASPRGETFINPTGNPGMASAGMGDVLTGMIAGLLAQVLKPLQAAELGVYLHGFIGDRLKDEKGVAGLLASDLMSKIPESLELLKTS